METDQCRAILGWKQSNPQWTGNYDYFQSAQPFEGELSPIQEISPLLLPPILTVEETCDVFGSPVLLERLCESDWLVPLAGHEESYFTAEAVYMAMARLIKGEKPPRSCSEKSPQPGEPEIGPKEKFITPQEAADFMAISVATLRDYADRGTVTSYRLPNSTHRRFRLSDLESAMQQGRIESFDSQVAELKDLLR